VRRILLHTLGDISGTGIFAGQRLLLIPDHADGKSKGDGESNDGNHETPVLRPTAPETETAIAASLQVRHQGPALRASIKALYFPISHKTTPFIK